MKRLSRLLQDWIRAPRDESMEDRLARKLLPELERLRQQNATQQGAWTRGLFLRWLSVGVGAAAVLFLAFPLFKKNEKAQIAHPDRSRHGTDPPPREYFGG